MEIAKSNKCQGLTLTVLGCALILSLGPMIGGYFLGRSIERFKLNDRVVVVKGLSEREVRSDLAIWELSYKNSGDDLTQLDKKMTEDNSIIWNFLVKQGFKEVEIQKGYSQVVDKMAQEYGNAENKTNRYIISGTLTVRSNNPNLVAEAASHLSEVIQKGVIVSGNPNFFYTKFLELRPDMIAEATKSAREAALQFANDSGAKVGFIRSANQGIFSISAKDALGDNYSGIQESSSIDKKVRLVSTITFSLEQ